MTKDDLEVIVTCFTEKDGLVLGLLKKFPNEKWNNYRNISRVLAKYRQTGSADCQKDSGRPLIAMTDENLAEVE